MLCELSKLIDDVFTNSKPKIYQRKILLLIWGGWWGGFWGSVVSFFFLNSV